MEPQVQYAKTTDGVSIAYVTLGAGAPLVYTPAGPLTNMQMELEVPAWRSYLELLAQKRMVVRYDNRGAGLSGGDLADLGLDAFLLDLESVVDRLGLDRFALFGSIMFGAAAVTYAARNPERISHLILFNTTARPAEFTSTPRDRALGKLMDADWELYTETVSHLTYGWSAGEAARQSAARMRETQTPEKLKLAWRAFAGMDATSVLSQVECPTLVLRRRQSFTSVGAARTLASGIPDARLTLLEGASVAPWMDDAAAVVSAIDEFLGEGEEVRETRGLAADDIHTILFTDVEGSTALTDSLGDAKARELLRQHERQVREALKSHGGSEVKALGDGFMASFSSATRALECAIAMQRAFAQHNESAEEPIKVRVGMNAGEPIAEDEDLFGASVNRAARIAAMAQGGEILAANVVRELAEGKSFLFSDRGDTTLRGFEDPVRVYEVSWRENA
jgi:class 3 adenylate cyclase